MDKLPNLTFNCEFCDGERKMCFQLQFHALCSLLYLRTCKYFKKQHLRQVLMSHWRAVYNGANGDTKKERKNQLKTRNKPMTPSLGDGLSDHIEEHKTTGHRQTTGPSVSSVIWATVQPGRNHGKGPGKRWVYCLSILLDLTDAHCLTGDLVFLVHFLGTSGFSHVQCDITRPT